MDADPGSDQGQQVDRQQVHGIHQEHPQENGQGQGRDQGVLAVKDGLDLAVDELDDRLEHVLHAGGLVGVEGLADLPTDVHQQPGEQGAEEQGV